MHYFVLSLVLVSGLFLQGCAPDVPEKTPEKTLDESAIEQSQQVDSSWYQSSGDNASAVDVLKSPADDRNYRYLTLENGLKVLLVSDPDADKAAASLSIDVGSFENPADRDGLAHFLEHMLFLGTDKYPEAGEYQAFLSEHGGTFNAYTSLEETNYFFDVDAQYLTATLDRFSRFFVAPLFNAEYVDRERHAVDSEYQLKIKDDSRREWDVLRELTNPEHPFSKFSVGSLDSLANPPENPVRDDLLAFYQKFYSASQMNLVVLGREPLDTLQQAVTERFTPVPAHKVDLPKTETPLFARPLPIKVQMQPEKELRYISFNFPLPTLEQDWRLKPMEYLGHLLGHEGEGSLLASLKARNLAEGLSAGVVYDSRHGALFSVQVNLTPEGVEAQDVVTGDFFRWLELIKTEGIEPWRYQEVARLAEQDFRFAEKMPPMRYVSALATGLHIYSPGDVLRASALYSAYDGDKIAAYGKHLNASNVAIMLVAPGVATEQQSKFYRTPFKVSSLDAATLAAKNPDQTAFNLPKPNPYIAEKLALKTPTVAMDKPAQQNGNLWFYQDSQFNTPKGYFEARVTLPAMNNLERRVMVDFLLALARDQLAAEAYPAMLAGLGFDLAPWENGYSLTTTGYSDKQALLLARMANAIAKPDWDVARVARVKDSMVRALRNTSKEWPLRQLFSRLPPLVKNDWLPTEKADALEKISLDQLQNFQRELVAGAEGRYYAGGNFSQDDAKALVAAVAEPLGLNKEVASSATVRNLVRSEQLPATYFYVDHDDSAALLYVQGDSDDLAERATFALLSNILSAPFYSTLRTEKQLGYAVGSTIAPMQRVPGALFYVQSPKVNAEALREEINGFLKGFEAKIEALSDDDLARYRQSVLATVEEKPRNINELAARHLESLNLGYSAFDFRPQLVAALNNIGREQLKTAYRRVMVGERAGLWLLTTEDKAVGSGAPLAEKYVEGEFSYPD